MSKAPFIGRHGLKRLFSLGISYLFRDPAGQLADLHLPPLPVALNVNAEGDAVFQFLAQDQAGDVLQGVKCFRPAADQDAEIIALDIHQDGRMGQVVARARQPEPALPQASKTTPDELTERELEVLRLIATGLSNREIAQALSIAEKTVKTHVSNILSKLHLANRTQAAIYALHEGLGPEE